MHRSALALLAVTACAPRTVTLVAPRESPSAVAPSPTTTTRSGVRLHLLGTRAVPAAVLADLACVDKTDAVRKAMHCPDDDTDDELVERDDGVIVAALWDRGYASAHVQFEPIARRPDGTMDVTFRIDEGPRCRVRTVEVVEFDAQNRPRATFSVPSPARARLLAAEGQWFARRDLAADLASLEAAYDEAAFAFAAVTTSTTLADGGRSMDVRIEIRPGASTVYGAITIEPPSEEAAARAVLRAHGVLPGARFSRAGLETARRALAADVRQPADVTYTQDRNDPAQADVDVRIGDSP